VPTLSESLTSAATEEGGVGEQEPGSPSSSNQLTLLPLCALIFYEVSGGPYGIEVGRALHARRLLWGSHRPLGGACLQCEMSRGECTKRLPLDQCPLRRLPSSACTAAAGGLLPLNPNPVGVVVGGLPPVRAKALTGGRLTVAFDCTQDSVRAGGPLLAVLGFLVLPLVWAIPEAMIAAELSTAFPENSGYVAWVTAAFGPWWGFQMGLWSWVSGVLDNGIYPVLFLAYLEEAVPELKAPQFHWCVMAARVRACVS
jgi:hypothetical protein